MRKRAAAVDETRLRITEAAVRLHTTLGPAHTTMSKVAEEAGVSRVTLYRHFPDEEQVFAACTAHWAAQHPPPDPATWLATPPVQPRARLALGELYAWYAENGDALYLFTRDADTLPAAVRAASVAADAAAADVLVQGSGARGSARRRLRAVAALVVGYPTWRTLAVDQALGNAAADVAVRLLLAATPPSRRD